MANAIATAILTLPLALAGLGPVRSVTESVKEIAGDQMSLANAVIPRPLAKSEPAAVQTQKPMIVFGLKPGAGTELRRSPDGLFYLNALVNDVPVRFLVDTGANAVILTAGDAQRVGVSPGSSQPSELGQTAGGRVAMTRIKLRSLEAGPMRKNNVEVVVTDADLPVSLLGQSWLSQLGSVTIAGESMVLQ